MSDPNAPTTTYYLLGRSGLRVSPLCLGAMTFGTDWGWGSDEADVRRILDRYVERGGNFIDTANFYTNGSSETLLGRWMRDTGKRDRVVLATKFTMTTTPGDPNGGGNGRKNIYQAIDASLRRLETDHVDLYWLHAWDGVTPVDEVMEALDALVRAGKVRYIGLSDTPSWYLARAQTLAELRGWSRVVALQLEYSLVERNIEREHVPAAIELGMAVTPWSPLAGGFLTGKYTRAGEGAGRLVESRGKGGMWDRFTERNWRILDVLVAVAGELGKSPAQVAINWVTKRPGVVSTIIGATRLEQLDDNLAALDFDIPPALAARLEEAGRPEKIFPYSFFEPGRRRMSGGVVVEREPPWYRR
jgi:aryl-alcohol dehydrogenase-like predicted oxidoreductase